MVSSSAIKIRGGHRYGLNVSFLWFGTPRTLMKRQEGWLPGTVSHIRRGQKGIRLIPQNLDEKRGEREQRSKPKQVSSSIQSLDRWLRTRRSVSWTSAQDLLDECSQASIMEDHRSGNVHTY